jgi:phosphohistidine phosphatase
MDRLILLRHGKADADATSGQDFDRALTDRGRRDTLVVCQAMAQADLYPDLVLVSPAVRALQTWEAAATVFARAPFETAAALYDIGPADLLALARHAGEGVRTLMIVGHNPGLGALSVHLAHEAQAGPEVMARVGMSFPTGAASVTHFDPPAFSLYAPKALGGGR